MQFKEIHIGTLIKTRVKELNIDNVRLNKFLQLTDEDINNTYLQESIDAKMLLRWSKILNYDFFRIYSQHLIFFSPASTNIPSNKKTTLPQFRKNIYTQEVIDFILQQINEEKKTKAQVITEYKIPKTTLYKWLKKHS